MSSVPQQNPNPRRTPSMSNKSAPFALSEDGLAAYEILGALREGEEISHEELAEQCRHMCENFKENRIPDGKVRNAIRKLLHEGVCIVNVWGVGWKRITEQQKPQEQVRHLNRSRNAAKRSIKVAASIDRSQLSFDERLQSDLNLTVAKVLITATDTEKQQGLERTMPDQPSPAHAEISVKKAMEHFLQREDITVISARRPRS